MVSKEMGTIKKEGTEAEGAYNAHAEACHGPRGKWRFRRVGRHRRVREVRWLLKELYAEDTIETQRKYNNMIHSHQQDRFIL